MVVLSPPEIKHGLTWQDLYLAGAFAQRELIVSDTLNWWAKAPSSGSATTLSSICMT